ncbi:MAG TPA: hypothetical protein VIJ99_09510 [Acidimicrobiales bacterium]
MKRAFLGLVVVVAIVVALLFVATRHSPSSASPPLISHTINATPANMTALKAAFLKYKLHNKEMVSTDRIKWGQLISPNGPNKPLIAYDAVDHREWALASFGLTLPASYKAEVSFQDGGSMGIFNKVGSGAWYMTGSPGLPLCAKDVPSVVAHLWGLKNYPACN